MSPRVARLDWALLLPATVELPVEEVLVVGGTDEMADALVHFGLARRWRRPTSPTDQGPMTVALADANCSLDRIARHVAPSGVLVVEIERHRRGRRFLSLRAVERQLARSGTKVYSAHLVEPSLHNPRRYLPIDHPDAIRWYLRTLFVAGTPMMRVVQLALSAVAASPFARSGLGSAARRMMVIAVPGSPEGSARSSADPASAAPAAGDALATAPIGSPDGRAGDRAIVLTSGYDTASRGVVVQFRAGQSSPSVVVKVASGTATAEGTLGEHRRLAELHAALPADLARSVPLPLERTSLIGRLACVQTCAEGTSMSASIGRWGRRHRLKRRELDIVIDWLIEFAAATRVDVDGARAPWMQVFKDVGKSRQLPKSVMDFLEAAEVTAVETGLAGAAVYQHYDTGPWNVHVGVNVPVLIDWETDSMRPADSLGPPLADVLYLTTYWYFQTSGAITPEQEASALVRLFAEPMPRDEGVIAARLAIDRSLVAAGLERRCVPAVLGALWAERALYTDRRRASLGTPLDAAESRPEAYLRVLAEEAPALHDRHGWWMFSPETHVAGHRESASPRASTARVRSRRRIEVRRR